MSMNLPLTELDKTFEEMRRNTRMGQAHWAGTGPAGRTCRECVHWGNNGYKANGMLKDAKCLKYTALSMREGHSFSHEALSCKYFEANDNPPSITKPKKVST